MLKLTEAWIDHDKIMVSPHPVYVAKGAIKLMRRAPAHKLTQVWIAENHWFQFTETPEQIMEMLCAS